MALPANFTNPTGKYNAFASLSAWLTANMLSAGPTDFTWFFTGTSQASTPDRIEVTEFSDFNPGKGALGDFLYPGAPGGQMQYGEAAQMRVQFDIFTSEDVDAATAKQHCYLLRDRVKQALRSAGQADANETPLLPAIFVMDYAGNPSSPNNTGILLTLDLTQNGFIENYYPPTADQPGVHHFKLLVRFQWFEMTH